MPLMRDAETGVVREVSAAYLKRWPGDYLELDEHSLPAGSEVPEVKAENTPVSTTKKVTRASRD